MPPNVDQFIMVFDLNNCGYANSSLSHVKMLFPFLENCFRRRQFCTIIIRSNWTMKAVQSMIMPFLNESTKQKIRMCGNDWSERLKELIDDDNLPEVYGGTAEFEYF